MTQIKYIVRRAFRYGKQHLKPGDEFVPAGGKFDEAILKSNLVHAATEAFLPAGRHAARMRRGHAKSGKRGIGGNFEPGTPKKSDQPLEPTKKKKVPAKKAAPAKPKAAKPSVSTETAKPEGGEHGS